MDPMPFTNILKITVPSELKQNSIGHFIIQSARPRSVIIPTLFKIGIGVEMDHVFGSRWGFSISYDEVNRYKQSVIQSESLEGLLTEYFPGTFTQWVADNVVHNVATLELAWYGNHTPNVHINFLKHKTVPRPSTSAKNMKSS